MCAATSRARGHARMWPSDARARGRRNDTDVRSECQSLLPGRVHLLISEECCRDSGHTHTHPPRRRQPYRSDHPQTSRDASLLVPPVRPGTPRHLIRLLHPELPPWRETSAPRDRDQTGEGGYEFLPPSLASSSWTFRLSLWTS